ncbi:phospholipase/carboxylesterase [Pseudarcicella hirudinis]|uniref:Phospholipase/carboxylesterase n=2 Tax=Pseudarcicella hirudinis TaxID=1079859 RepID=A0A1I5MPV1_9BACT|nr:phospholipase/carboxylesterase [Pseudarcicella hirudinis]
MQTGLPLKEADKVIIMVHGRGASADSILSLKSHLKVEKAAFFAPQAKNHTWYPFSFLAPVQQNQPYLDEALETLSALVEEIKAEGIPANKIYLLGFSQGACLTLEFAARNASKYGGVIAFTGGLIGEKLNLNNYQGDFNQTPILITTGDPDPHVPVSRVNESAEILKKMNAEVWVEIFKGRPHTIEFKELELANQLLNL